MKLVIVDDEPLARERLCRLVEEFPAWDVVGQASNGTDGLQVIRDTEPDLALLDIRMGGMDGLQLARALAELDPPPAVIFTTAYSEHALSAFDAHAIGYLLKPIRRDKLRDALSRARRPTQAQLQALEKLSRPATSTRQHILATVRDSVIRVPVEKILYFLADQKYTTVYHLHGDVLIEESLKALESSLGERFCRVHRKALVAREYIHGMERSAEDGHYYLMIRHTETRIPISRRRLAEVRRILAAD